MQIRSSKAHVMVVLVALAAVLAFSLLAVAGDLGLYEDAVQSFEAAAPPVVSARSTPQPTGAMYVKFEGVDGEAQDKDHAKWCDLLSFSQGQSVPAAALDPSRRAGGVVFEDFVLVKALDKASPKLAEAVCRGQVLPKVDIHVTSATSTSGRATYYAYELRNVRVVSYHVTGNAQSGQTLEEEVGLTFEEITVVYTELDAAGNAKGNVEYSWDSGDSLR